MQLASKSSRRAACLALLLLIITSTFLIFFYHNHPRVDTTGDTHEYLLVAQRLWTDPRLLVNIWRLPGYPFFIDLVYLVAGYGNVPAVSAAQALLFVLTTLEIFWLALLLFQRAWLAFVVGLLVGTNTMIINHIKPIVTEALSAFFLTTLALCIIIFICRMRIWKFWLISLIILLLMFTRPEWTFLPIPLFLYFLLVVSKEKNGRKFVYYAIHSFIAVSLLYLCVAAYVEINSVQNHFAGTSYRINYDVLGKVVQYHMQNETLPKDRATSSKLNQCIRKYTRQKFYLVVSCMAKSFKGNGASGAGQFAWAIILHHPAEFLAKTFPLFFTTLFDIKGRKYAVRALPWLQSFYEVLYHMNILFPICAAIWLFLLWRKWRSCPRDLLGMGAIILCLLCGIIVTAAGTFSDYLRVHTVFNPLLLLVLWGSIIRGLCCLFVNLRRRNRS